MIFTSFLGGLVNSTAAVAELSSRVRTAGEGFTNLAFRGVVLATGAMLLRNSLILAILASHAFAYSMVPMLLMLVTTAILLRFGARPAIGKGGEPPPDLKLEQPFSLKAALKLVGAKVADRFDPDSNLDLRTSEDGFGGQKLLRGLLRTEADRAVNTAAC